MLLWSIHTQEAYYQLKQYKTLHTLERHINIDNQEKIIAYKYMRKKLAKFTNYKPESNRYPIWCWYKYAGLSEKLNLESFCKYYPNQRIVQFTIEVDDDKVLLSNYTLFQKALNLEYIAKNEIDEKVFNSKYGSYNNLDKALLIRKELEESWNCIFDLEYCRSNPYFNINKEYIQGCIWEINDSDIKNVDFVNCNY